MKGSGQSSASSRRYQLRRVARRPRAAGFTLLEVLVAIAILGLGLTVVLSAQTGVFWSYQRITHLSRVPGLLRCKMEEVELELLREGFPLVDENDEGECCGDDDLVEGYRCSWTIAKVELPDLPTAGGSDGDAGAGDFETSSSEPLGGAIDGLTEIAVPAASGGGIGDFASALGGSGGGGGIASFAMTAVYPALKPMLEASIRKVTVKVLWQDGDNSRELAATQYLTQPLAGGFDPSAADGVEDATDQLFDQLGGGAAGGANPGAAAQ